MDRVVDANLLVATARWHTIGPRIAACSTPRILITHPGSKIILARLFHHHGVAEDFLVIRVIRVHVEHQLHWVSGTAVLVTVELHRGVVQVVKHRVWAFALASNRLSKG